MTNLFDYVLLAMAAYVLYAGITGKGKLYVVENIKEGKEEEFRGVMRKIYIGLGAAMLLNAAVSILMNTLYTFDESGAYVPAVELGQWSFLTSGLLRILVYVFLGLTIAGVVLMIVMMRKYVDKTAQQKSAATGADTRAARQAGHTLPVDAFDFTEDAEEDPAVAEARARETAEAALEGAEDAAEETKQA